MAEARGEILIEDEVHPVRDAPLRQGRYRKMVIAVHEARPRDAQVRICAPSARFERAVDCLEWA
jgi:hypothetical protein